MRMCPRVATSAVFGGAFIRRLAVPAGAFFLTLGLSACDLPLIAQTEAAPGLSGARAAAPAVDALKAVATAEIPSASVSF